MGELAEDREERLRRRRAQIEDWLTEWAFFGILGGFLLVGIIWIFFTHLPMPRYCGTRRTSAICGWISRDPPAAPAPRA